MKIGLYTLTSQLHDERSIEAALSRFLAPVAERLAADAARPLAFELRGADFSDYGSHDVDVIYVRTGGTEGLFRELFGRVSRTAEGRPRPVRLLASEASNSLAASMEILSFLQQRGCPGEILHGSAAQVAGRLRLLAEVEAARRRLRAMRLGVIGRPSDWLIASDADPARVRERLGVELVEIPIGELFDEVARGGYPATDAVRALEGRAAALPERVKPYWQGALAIYGGLRRLIERRGLHGFTLRCFDLLDRLGNTGCLALALLNAEGIPAGCEGDVPALLTLAVAQALTGCSGFQANPSRIDPATGEILLAHCTVPFDMLRSHTYDTHFESGRGVAVRGELPEGDVTLFKLSGDAARSCVFEGSLLGNPRRTDLCRTQVLLRAEGAADYFLRRPIGNHHVVLPGRQRERIEALLAALD